MVEAQSELTWCYIKDGEMRVLHFVLLYYIVVVILITTLLLKRSYGTDFINRIANLTLRKHKILTGYKKPALSKLLISYYIHFIDISIRKHFFI